MESGSGRALALSGTGSGDISVAVEAIREAALQKRDIVCATRLIPDCSAPFQGGCIDGDRNVAAPVIIASLPDGGATLTYPAHGSRITIRLTKELAEWLADKATRSGLPQGRIVCGHLERARASDQPGFMRLAGSVNGGPRDVSTRKGFSVK